MLDYPFYVALFAVSIVVIALFTAFVKSNLSLTHTEKINVPNYWYVYFTMVFLLLLLLYLEFTGAFSPPTYFPRVWIL